MNNCVRSVWVSDLLPLEFLKKKRVTQLMRAPFPQCKVPDPTVEEGEVAEAPITHLVTVSFLEHLLSKSLKILWNPQLSLDFVVFSTVECR